MAAIMDRLMTVAAQQRGFVTPDDAAAVDVDPVELRKLAARGRLEHWGHGLYRLVAYPHRANDELLAAVLWTRKRGVIGGDTALALHELCDVNPKKVTLVLDPGYRLPRKRGGELYQLLRDELHDADIEVIDDIPVVVPRTAIAEAAQQGTDPRLIEQAIQTALRRGAITDQVASKLRMSQVATASTAAKSAATRYAAAMADAAAVAAPAKAKR